MRCKAAHARTQHCARRTRRSATTEVHSAMIALRCSPPNTLQARWETRASSCRRSLDEAPVYEAPAPPLPFGPDRMTSVFVRPLAARIRSTGHFANGLPNGDAATTWRTLGRRIDALGVKIDALTDALAVDQKNDIRAGAGTKPTQGRD